MTERQKRLARMYSLIQELDSLTDADHTLRDAVDFGSTLNPVP